MRAALLSHSNQPCSADTDFAKHPHTHCAAMQVWVAHVNDPLLAQDAIDAIDAFSQVLK